MYLHFLVGVDKPTYISEALFPTQNSPVKTLMLGKVHVPYWKACLFRMDLKKTFLWEQWLFFFPKRQGKKILHRFCTNIIPNIIPNHPLSLQPSSFWSLWPLTIYLTQLILRSAAWVCLRASGIYPNLLFSACLLCILCSPTPSCTELQYMEG